MFLYLTLLVREIQVNWIKNGIKWDELFYLFVRLNIQGCYFFLCFLFFPIHLIFLSFFFFSCNPSVLIFLILFTWNPKHWICRNNSRYDKKPREFWYLIIWQICGKGSIGEFFCASRCPITVIQKKELASHNSRSCILFYARSIRFYVKTL